MRALKEVKLADLRAEVAEAALTNDLRSGERGKTAQNRLLSLEARCSHQDRLATSGPLVLMLTGRSLDIACLHFQHFATYVKLCSRQAWHSVLVTEIVIVCTKVSRLCW